MCAELHVRQFHVVGGVGKEEALYVLYVPYHDFNRELTDVKLCTHGLIKLSKTGGLYANATKRRNLKDRTIRQQWMELKTHFIAEYEKMLAANGGTTMGQEGYGTGGA